MPIRNVRELRTFNPKLKDSTGGEVNEMLPGGGGGGGHSFSEGDR